MKRTLLEIYKKRIDYLILFAVLFLGLIVFFGLFGLPSLRIQSVIALCVFYFCWGIVHHWLEKDLHIKIVVEYFLVATIACLILLSLIWRA